MERIFGWLAAFLIGLFALTACAEPARDADDGAAEADYAVEDADAEAGAAEEPPAVGDGAAAEDPDREIVTTASAELEVDDPAEAVREAVSRTESAGGHVEDRRESTDEHGRPETATLVLRVPAGELDGLIDGLEDIGEVTDLSQSARDVTGTARDLDARIEALQTSVDRLLEIMEEADSAEDLLQAETTLSERQADLEALQAQRNALSDQVEMSTLELHMTTEQTAEVEADGFAGGLQSGWNALVGVFNGLLVAAGALLPWIPVIAVPVLIIWFVVSRWSRRRRHASAEPAEKKSAEEGNFSEADGDSSS